MSSSSRSAANRWGRSLRTDTGEPLSSNATVSTVTGSVIRQGSGGLYTLSSSRREVCVNYRAMPSVRIEFLVEPFTEGRPGPHVQAGIEVVRARGLEPEVGPF